MARARFAALLFLMLAACGREGATGPFADSRSPSDIGPRFLAPDAWTWGYVQVGDNPPQRYGVGSTWRAPRANVVVLPGYGEGAETWFETVRDLTRQGYTVWVLDRVGQGGSGRYAVPRDLGYAPSLEPDIAALTSLVRVVIRPRPGTPLVLLGQAEGAVVALRAVETGLGVDGLILSAPRLAGAEPARTDLWRYAEKIPALDRLPTPDYQPWTREQPDDLARGVTHDPWRGAVNRAWQVANPDLRMTAPSPAWRRALSQASAAARRDASRVGAPVLLLTAGAPSHEDAALCASLPACRLTPIPGGRPALHLEADTWRAPWFAGVSAFVAGKVDRARQVKAAMPDENSPTPSETSEDGPAPPP